MKKFLKRSLVVAMIALLLLSGGAVKKLYDQDQAQQTVIHTQSQQIKHLQEVIDYQNVRIKINDNRIQYQNIQLKDIHNKQVATPKVKVMSADDVRKELADKNDGLVLHTQQSVLTTVIGSIAVMKELVFSKLHMN